MATFRVERNNNYTTMANYHFLDKTLSWKAKGILSNMLSLPEDWDYSLAGLATLSSDGASATRSAIKELEEHGYLIRRPIRDKGRIVDWEYIIFECPQAATASKKDEPEKEKQDVGEPVVENLNVVNHTQLNTKESNIKESNTKEKERKKGSAKKKTTTTYDEILSGVQDESLRATYHEFIKMRTLMKKPMTNHALELLVKKVNDLEPSDTSRQIKLLETAIERNWMTVYPLKDDGQNGNNNKSKNNNGKWCLGTNADDEPYPF